jgi:lipopolysaccharide heptosyltransferase II
VILAPNWLGDAVMALPAVDDVRRGLPGVTITIAARPGIAPLFRLVPGVDVLTLGGGRRDGDTLPRSRFDAAILLPNSFRSALLVSRARVPERWGYRTDWRGRLLTRAVDPPRGVHQIEYYRRLVSALGFPNGAAEPRLDVPADARAAAGAQLRAAGWDGSAPLVAIAPGAAYGGAKRWPAESFAALARDLGCDGIVVVMIGSGADRIANAEVARACRGRDGSGPEGAVLLDLTGATDLATLAGVFAHCRALVTNDSGAMHLAAAVGTRVTAVFGPTDDRATRLLSAAHTTIVGDAWCRPCMLRECPIDHRCMRSVPVGRVAGAARRSLHA